MSFVEGVNFSNPKTETNSESFWLILCLLQLDANGTCFSVEAERSIKVDKLKPALVKVYDYYKVEEAGRTFYLPEAPEKETA